MSSDASLLVISPIALKSGKNTMNIESSMSSEIIAFDIKDEFDSSKKQNQKCALYSTNLSKLNDSSFLSSINKSNEPLSPSIISLIQNKFKLNEHFSFPKDKVILFTDPIAKSNDFLSLFSKAYELSPTAEMLKKDPYEFKIVDKKRIRSIIAQCKTEGNPILAMYNKNAKLGIKHSRTSSTIIIQTQNLTKIPMKRNSQPSMRLNYEFKKAKSAAVHVRRMEYAYHMEILTFKFKFECIDKAKIIQCWWRAMKINNIYNYLATRIQSSYRGRLGRLAMGDTLYIVNQMIPFVHSIENLIMKHKTAKSFETIYNNYGYINFSRRIPEYLNKIRDAFREYYINKCIRLKEKNKFTKPKKEKCLFIKKIFDIETRKRLNKVIANVKGYLSRNNEKIMRKISFKVHPYLFYKNKYKDINKYKEKIEKFHQCFHKFRLLNLRVNQSIDNEFEYIEHALKKEIMSNLAEKAKSLYNNKKVLKDMVRKYDLKKYFKLWLFRTKNIKKINELFYIPTKFTSKHKLIRMKKEMKHINYTQFAIDINSIFNTHLKKEALSLISKFSPLYTCKLLIKRKISRDIKPYFILWKNKSKALALLEHYQNLIKKRTFNKWAKIVYESNPQLFKLKLVRNSIARISKKNNIILRHKFNQWKEKVFNDVNYKMKQYQENNLKLLRFHLWMKNAQKLKYRQKKYISAILKAHNMNEKYFISNCKEHFFNRWKLHNDIHNKYIAPINNIKLKMFALTLESTFSLRQLIIYKAYFFKTLFILNHWTQSCNNNK